MYVYIYVYVINRAYASRTREHVHLQAKLITRVKNPIYALTKNSCHKIMHMHDHVHVFNFYAPHDRMHMTSRAQARNCAAFK
jgi:hypothetical protein